MADPVTLLSLGVGLLGGLGGTLLGGNKTPSAPQLPPAAPPVQQPTGTQTSNANTGANQPSFLAAAAAPGANNLSGSKSLLGQ